MNIDNNEIMRTIAQDKEKGFRLLMAKFSEPLYWHIRRLVVSHDDAQDAEQETFIKAYRSIDKLDNKDALTAWIYRIATNETLNFLRKQKVRAALSFRSIDAEMERMIDDDPYFNGNAAQRKLMKLIQKLPQKQRVVFSLRYFDDMKYEDIAQITGTTVGALKASYHIAYEKIKKELI